MSGFDHLEFSGPDDPRTAPAQAPSGAHDAYRAARRMREAGHFQSAATLYQRAIGFEERRYAAWIELVDCLVRGGDLDGAEHKASEALENYKQVRAFYAARALTLAHKGAIHAAWPLSDVSLEGGPDAYAMAVRAELLLRQSPANHKPALELLAEALRIAEAPWDVCFAAGSMLLAANQAPLAAGYFSEAVHVKPRAAAALIGLGDCFFRLRLYDQALFYYQQVTRMQPRHETALNRQRECAPKTFGLLRVFRRNDLQHIWNKRFERLTRKEELDAHDF